MAQTLKFGNKTWATKVGSTLAYNDENGNYKPLPFAFTRSTSATRVNKEGLIEVVTNDRPRIDYTDTSDGVLLLENAATNLETKSNEFSTWQVNSNITRTANYIVSPDGTLNGTRLQFTANGFSSNTTQINSTQYTVSCYAKRNDSGTQNVGFFINGTGVVDSAWEITSEWKRFTYTYTTGNTSFVGISALSGADVSVFGFQVEQNSVASSYIPTQGSAVTRVAETASGAGNSEVFNDSEGVLFADVISNGGTTDGYISISDLTTNNRLAIRIGYNNSNKVSLFMVSNGGSAEFEEFYDVGSLGFRNFNKFALKYKVNDVSLFFNGFEVITISSAAMASGFKSLNFANATGGTQPFYGKTKEIGYYDAILTDLELEYLTSYRSWESMVNELNLNIIYNG